MWEIRKEDGRPHHGGQAKTEVIVRCRLTDVRSFDCNPLHCQPERLPTIGLGS
ncbi:MAG: hypothetical protein ACK4SF_05605 [Algoriphagus aquaeductus]|uniref:hypothetical protein n=1 Tax=Algoriphagus aquaeductus TaxID=475299 RepID=UPI00391CE6C0